MEKQEFNNSQTEQQLQRKVYSLLPDLLTGWKPRNIKIPAPIIITYQAMLSDLYYHHYKTLNKIVFLGQRYPNSYLFHNQINHQYQIKYGLDSKQMPLTFQKTLDIFSEAKNRPFRGMNPLIKNELQFDSNFQSGNLDMALKIQENQYDLFLRPDTNTCGHMQWFYFKITKTCKYKHKTIKINILNNRRAKTLYSRGMRPYIFSKVLKETQNIQWKQGGYNITYSQLQLRDELQNVQKLTDEKQYIKKHWCLSFQYQFEANQDQVYFSYCPPYTYSQMKGYLQQIKKNTNSIIQEQTLCLSLSGLQIPILTITNTDIPENQKRYVVAIGRIHPGQANGSYVIKGFLDYIISPQAKQLLNKFIFIVIPMINPDGVVFGNFRSGLCGKDLNRKFKAKNIQLFPQVIQLRKYFTRLRLEKKAKFMLFLDFHGHSMKKNVFFYGPQYDIWTSKYTRSKILPKMLANKTQMFRYQSCIFRVAAEKKTTARAYMLGFIPYCYTIQSSAGLYRSFKKQEDEQFTIEKWQQMGKIVGQSLQQMHQKLYQDGFLKKKKRKQKIILKQEQTSDQKDKIEKKSYRKFRLSERKIKSRSFCQEKIVSCQKTIEQNSRQKIETKIEERKSSSKKYRGNVKNVRKEYINNLVNIEFPLIAQQQCESDKFSQGKSDCQSDDNDLNKDQYKTLSGNIMHIIDGFNKYVGMADECKMLQYKSHRKRKLIKRKKSSEMDMVPSLKYKNLMRGTEKKIGEFLFDDIVNKIKF